MGNIIIAVMAFSFIIAILRWAIRQFILDQ